MVCTYVPTYVSVIIHSGVDESLTCNQLRASKGLMALHQAHKRHFYGPNQIVIEVKSYIRLLFEEVYFVDRSP